MSLVRCPACGRVASGASCFACGHSLDGALNVGPSSALSGPEEVPYIEEIFDTDELGVVTEPTRQPPPLEAWAVRVPGQSLDVLSPPPQTAPIAWAQPSSGPVVEGIVFDDDGDDDLAVVQGAPIVIGEAEEVTGPPSTTGYAASPDLRSTLDPFAPFARSPTPPLAFAGQHDDLSMMADLASESGLGLLDLASSDLANASEHVPVEAFEVEHDFGSGPSLDVDSDFTSHQGQGSFDTATASRSAPSAASFGIEMSEGIEMSDGFDVGGGIEMSDGFDVGGGIEMSDGFDVGGGIEMTEGFGDARSIEMPTDDGSTLAMTDGFEMGAVDEFANGAIEHARDHSISSGMELSFDAAFETEPARFGDPGSHQNDDVAMAAAFFSNDDIDMPATDVIGDLESASTLGDATALIARPVVDVDPDTDATAVIRAPLLHAAPFLSDEESAGLEGAPQAVPGVDAGSNDVDLFGEMSGVSFPDDNDAVPPPPDGLSFDDFAADDLSRAPYDDVPEPPSLDDLDVPQEDDGEATLPLVARPVLALSSIDFGDVADDASSSAASPIAFAFDPPSPDAISDLSAPLLTTTPERTSPMFARPDESLEAFAVEIALPSLDAPGTVRATVDAHGDLAPHSAHAGATRLHETPFTDDGEASAPVTIDRAYARDMSARVVALAEEMEGTGRFEAAALLYEVQAALDGT